MEYAAWKPQSQLITAAELPELFAKHSVVVIGCRNEADADDSSWNDGIGSVKSQFADDVGFFTLDIYDETNIEFCLQHDVLDTPALVGYVDGIWQGTYRGHLSAERLFANVRDWQARVQPSFKTSKEFISWTISSSRPQRYARSPKFAPHRWIRHSITLRMHDDGISNLSFSVTQDWEDVRRNRDFACRVLLFTPGQLVVPAQTHGANVAVVGATDAGRGALSPDTAIPNCDALVTNTPGLLLGITIADCLPVFFLDPVHNAIGLAHSGWRGTAGRIVVRTLETMQQHFGTQPQDCLIAIGPGIGPEAYEVDQQVYDGFTSEDREILGAFMPTRPGHWQLDLYAAVCHQLRQAGVPSLNFDVCQYRTNRNTDLFFSHRLVPGCGRMGAFIGIKSDVRC